MMPTDISSRHTFKDSAIHAAANFTFILCFNCKRGKVWFHNGPFQYLMKPPVPFDPRIKSCLKWITEVFKNLAYTISINCKSFVKEWNDAMLSVKQIFGLKYIVYINITWGISETTSNTVHCCCFVKKLERSAWRINNWSEMIFKAQGPGPSRPGANAAKLLGHFGKCI